MGSPIEELLWQLDARAEKGGWDQPAELYVVFPGQVPNEDIPMRERPDSQIGEFLVGQLPGWGAAAKEATSAQEALDIMIEVYSSPGVTKAPIAGLVMVMEAWMADHVSMGHDDLEKLREDVANRQLHKRADRIESRVVLFADALGQHLVLTHERDGVPKFISEGWEGALPEMLSELAVALTDRQVVGLLVRASGEAKLISLPPTLEVLRGIVGGHIESVTISPDCHLYCDEEGKMKPYEMNLTATTLARSLGWPPGDVLVGDVVFLGGRGPEEEDVADRVIEKAKALGIL